MSRILFATFMLVHGLIHLLGFAKQWELAEVSLLSGKSLIPVSEATTRVLGAGWFVAYLLFMMASLGCFRRRSYWMPTALLALVLSQALIVFYWPDAWVGTPVNIFIALVLAFAYSKDRFGKQIDSEIQALFSQPGSKAKVVTAERLTGLPLPVQKWLTESGVIGKKEVSTVRLRQEGTMHTSPIGYYFPVEAEQFIRVDRPGFVWKADLRAFSFLPIRGRDKYIGGRGHMLIKALSMIPLANARGPKIDQGTLLRFLGEICWVPSAALIPYLKWKAVDDDRAQASMTYEGITASAVFHFDERHRLVSVSARSYMENGKDSQLVPWVVTCKVWEARQGVKIPTQGYATWKLPEGDFNYYDWEITDIEYDQPNIHQARVNDKNRTDASNVTVATEKSRKFGEDIGSKAEYSHPAP